ncbi:SagB/ThcOx family dehydrogenase [Methylomonas sp. AM2-LC]|uniref:SagB/ThcOx family dehydrogenase n=1 Tax=Methylomonas sp. AM2-LC TaxID=3153301 RepID=UPI0032646491
MSDATDFIRHYHQRTKHQINAYAAGPASLDWDDQPNPFRRFSGCEIVTLPTPGSDLDALFAELDNPERISSQALDLQSLGLLLELSFGLSAWKQFGPDRWALRCNPSSGNLHPTEAYVLCSDATLLIPGVYHYVSHDHHLERRGQFKVNPVNSEIFIALSSIHWREAWKYGERAFRYCQHDIGHALAALSYAAACLGWSIELCSSVADSEIAAGLGLNQATDFIASEHESADILCRIITPSSPSNHFNPVCLSSLFASTQWFGTAEQLSGRHFYRWPIIDDVSKQAEKPATPIEHWQPEPVYLAIPKYNLTASKLIRQRRSAQNFNGKADPIPLADFQRMLCSLLPNQKPPFSAWNWSPAVHIFIFVHRVENLAPGLYFLPRNTTDIPSLQAAFSADFVWQTVPAPCSFYLLTPGNVRQAAQTLSCHQAIASDSAFSLGMLARFADTISTAAWNYRRLFWECGLLGQILYLEAEAVGLRGTGIGCFFDDAVHGVLGLKDDDWQSLYHFTVGTPKDDNRLQTLPAYTHLLSN